MSALASDPALGNQHISVSFQPDGLSRRFGEPRLVIEQAAASGLSVLNCWVEVLQLDAGVFGREPPVDPTAGPVAGRLPR